MTRYLLANLAGLCLLVSGGAFGFLCAYELDPAFAGLLAAAALIGVGAYLSTLVPRDPDEVL